MAVVLVALPASYLAVLSLAALMPRRKRVSDACLGGAAQPTIAIVIPAHNEELLIKDALDALHRSMYPPERFRVFVVADNCTDQTAIMAEERGAVVAPRMDLVNRGKGYAIDWFLRSWKQRLEQFEVIAVIDADTIVDSLFLAEVGKALAEGGAHAVQAYYGVANLESGWRACLAEVAFAVSHHLRPLGRNRIGASCGLKGNGMAFRSEVLLQRGWPAHSIVEDLEFGLLLIRDGLKVEYVPEAKVFAEMVTEARASNRQRVRWEGGRLQILKHEGGKLFAEAVRRRDFRLLEAWIDLVCPPLALYAGVLLLALGVGIALKIWALVAAVSLCGASTVGHVLLALWSRRVPMKVWRSLFEAPQFLLGKIPVYFHLLLNGAGTEWVRTLRNGELPPSKYSRFVSGGRGDPAWWSRLGKLRIAEQCLYLRCAVVGKRVLDIIGSIVALVLLSPIMVITAILIKLEDGGPVLFTQTRIGLYGRKIQVIKFRSMVPTAERIRNGLECSNQHISGVTFKMRRDPRVTKVGRWIRKFSIDEMPQFFNVLIGDMALVGPRPALPKEVACYNATQLLRLCVKPGISCLWQIRGRADIDFEGQVRLDLEYIQKFSVWRDIVILLKTIPAVVLARGAY